MPPLVAYVKYVKYFGQTTRHAIASCPAVYTCRACGTELFRSDT
jgi:hypothetical protein